MGILSGLMAAFAQTAHGFTKGLDEAAEITGAPPFVCSMTKGLVNATALFQDAALSVPQGGDVAAVSYGGGSVGGGNAPVSQGLVTQAQPSLAAEVASNTKNVSEFHFDPSELGMLPPPNVGRVSAISTGMNV